MEETKNIIFDLGGVILNLDNRKTEDAFHAMGAKNFREYFGPGMAASFFREYETGKINDQQFLVSLRDLIHADVPDPVLIMAWNAMLLDFPPERIRLLDDLRSQKYRLFLFSNTNALHLKEVHRIYSSSFPERQLDDHFEKAYYSHLMGMRKPDAESFHLILAENNLQAEATLFVDDTLVNIEAARRLGLKAVHLTPGMQITNIRW
jgi:putative hydrolase of the HAD superfamily